MWLKVITVFHSEQLIYRPCWIDYNTKLGYMRIFSPLISVWFGLRLFQNLSVVGLYICFYMLLGGMAEGSRCNQLYLKFTRGMWTQNAFSHQTEQFLELPLANVCIQCICLSMMNYFISISICVKLLQRHSQTKISFLNIAMFMLIETVAHNMDYTIKLQ